MAPTGPTMKAAPGRLSSRSRSSRPYVSSLASLDADSHRPDVQEIIREGIRRGTLRVQPLPGSDSKVRIVRVVPTVLAAAFPA